MNPPSRTSDFDYALPAELIAQQPVEPRDAARMLVLGADGALSHRLVRELPAHLLPGDVMVVNNSRVIPARTWARRETTGGRVELLWIEPRDDGSWTALVRSRRPVRPGDRLRIGTQVVVVEDGRFADGTIAVRLEGDADVLELLEHEGHTPLPPYIRRGRDEPADRERYQTVYARRPGSVAAPTAGLHFTEELLCTLRERGVQIVELTLHVGPGTFRPVREEDPARHSMHVERFEIPEATAEAISRARSEGRRVLAIGTTVVRALESVADEHGRVRPGAGRTALFIRPPYEFRVVDLLLTNFHLPRSTLLMLVCAFAGTDRVLAAYHTAIEHRYRFYSYGDCMLLARPARRIE
ncbi:MAG: tRNA preQ1(34) S-adenosylmethionine ribosyltransferase-isomerase QueA [Kiritimatiellae bacterium]|nr:tRNA preQ1(34) S-adenosylmethionine ribosyltransferase-isomerase QueA [Kiritimatiellia bacterium]